MRVEGWNYIRLGEGQCFVRVESEGSIFCESIESIDCTCGDMERLCVADERRCPAAQAHGGRLKPGHLLGF